MSLTVESWIEALESGKYKQARSRLKDIHVEAFCCLGVACDLSGMGRWGDDAAFIANGGYREALCLPISIRDVIGLDSDTGRFEIASLPDDLRTKVIEIYDGDPPKEGELTALNDRGASFHFIAKVIRARPKGLFREDATP